MSFAILRTAKLKSLGNIGGSLAHNYRTIETPNADPLRTANNLHSLSTAESVKDAISDRLPEKRRSDAVLCIEHMITASPEWDGWNDERQHQYFEQAKEWLEKRYGKDNVVATSIHRDETTPHLVAYVVPLDPDTGRLNAKKFLGGRQKLAEMQTDFAKEVERFGLHRGIEGSKAKHTRIKEYYTKINEPIPELKPIERPKAGFFETTAQYGDKVVQSVMEQIKPQWETMAEIAKDISNSRQDTIEAQKEASEARHALLELQRTVKPYLDAIEPLGSVERIEFNKKIASLSNEIEMVRLNKDKQRENEYAAKTKLAEKALWDKTYQSLSSGQREKVDRLISDYIDHYKDNDVLRSEIQKAKEAIIKRPSILDSLSKPTAKDQKNEQPEYSIKPKSDRGLSK